MRCIIIGGLLLVAFAAPCAAQQMQPMAGATPADQQFVAAMRDMMVAMHQGMPTGDTDKDFVRLMLPHHKSAVEMAQTELHYGTDPELKALAQNIVDDQNKEIATMQAWLGKHPK